MLVDAVQLEPAEVGLAFAENHENVRFRRFHVTGAGCRKRLDVGHAGETVGNALDGKKTVIGIAALVVSIFLPQLAPLTTFLTDTVVAGDGKMAVSTVQNVLMPLASLFTGWGALGKIDKWIHKPSVATIGGLLKRLGDG